MDFHEIVLYILIGFVAMVSGGFWGMGGGWFIVPALLVSGVAPLTAVPASLLQMIPSTVFIVFRDTPKLGWKKGQWGMGLALPLCIMSFCGGFLGRPIGIFIENIFHSRKPHMVIYLILLAYIFYKTLRRRKGEEKLENAKSPRMILSMITGLLAGTVSSLLGIGGGVITRPAMKSFLKVPENITAMTARLGVLVAATAGSISYLSGIDKWDSSQPGVHAIYIAVFLAVGGIVGFPIGAKMHVLVMRAGNEKSAHYSYAIIVFLVFIGVLCKVTGYVRTSQVFLAVCGFFVLVILVIITLNAKRKINSDENRSP